MDSGNEWQREPFSVEAEQGQREFPIGQELRQIEDHEFDAGMVLEERDEALQADGLGFEERTRKRAGDLIRSGITTLAVRYPVVFGTYPFGPHS